MDENEEYQLESKAQTSTRISDKDITHILEICGSFGPYQHWLLTYIFMIWMLTEFPAVNMTFLTASVPFLCYPPNCNASLIPANLTENEYLQMLQPDGDDQCSVYNNSFTGTYYTTPPSNSSKLQCPYGRKFLTEEFSTIVSEFDLICERKWLKSTLQSVYFVGYLVGSIVFGILCDRFVTSLLYYGVTLNSVDVAGNHYLNYLLLAVVELPSLLFCCYLFTRFDHRKPISFIMMFSGLNCIVSNFVTEGSFWFPVILVVLVKFGISAAFASNYLLSAEIFPTVVRTNGLGISSVFSCVGSISSPFILQLSFYAKWLPLSIYGVLSVISSILLLFLPETKDKDLPQTFEDLDN
ncbi:organic cation transporter protein [Octopus bimaculoides]|nr:organic cation transporter protein [Octopus bimaculoides]|eukprot:XP_014774902.1 PREDICTED: organic cation transporter protein-like [Octopus bimaculoides]